MVSTEEIAAEDWTLNISRYVLPPVGADVPPLPEAVAAFKGALAAEDRLRRVLAEDGWLEVSARRAPRVHLPLRRVLAEDGWLE